jgi:hypothetical protein
MGAPRASIKVRSPEPLFALLKIEQINLSEARARGGGTNAPEQVWAGRYRASPSIENTKIALPKKEMPNRLHQKCHSCWTVPRTGSPSVLVIREGFSTLTLWADLNGEYPRFGEHMARVIG